MSCGWTLSDSGLSIQGGLLWSRNGAKVEVRVCISESPRGDAHWKSLQLWYWRLSEAIGWGNALHVLTVDQVSVFHYWRGDASPSCSSNLQPPEVSEQLTSTSLMFGLLQLSAMFYNEAEFQLIFSFQRLLQSSGSGALSHITWSSHQSGQANKLISVIPFFSSYWTFYNYQHLVFNIIVRVLEIC